ncbi:MAG: 50S ribosomal protein L29 [Solirubrobacteraceae bacterium]
MSARDLRDIPEAELSERVTEARRDLFGLRFQHATGELENTSGLRASRRALARALTVAREREMVAREREISAPSQTEPSDG